MQIYSNTCDDYRHVDPALMFISMLEDVAMPMVIMDVGRYGPDSNLYTSDFLINSERQYIAFCRLANLSINARDSYYQYLDALHQTYTYH